MKINKLIGGGIRISNLPKSGVQKVMKSTLSDLRDSVTVTDKSITFHTVDGDVVFQIVYPPGAHCLTCGEQFLDRPLDPAQAAAAIKHVEAHGKDAVKTDRWPHGYLVAQKHYVCTIEDQREPVTATEADEG